MKTLNQQQLLWMLAATGLAVLPHFGHLPMPLSLWFLCVFAWRLLAVWRPAILPGAAVRLILIVLGLGLLVGFKPENWGVSSGAAIFVVALAIKLLEFNQQRDAYLINYLGFILIGALFLYRQDMLATGFGLVVCWLLLSALLTVNGSMLRSKTVLRQSGILLLQAVPMAVVLFLLFPRVQAPAWGWTERIKEAETGMSDTLEQGTINRLALSPKLVFRVKFDGDVPPTNQLYWRGPVYSFTDGNNWTIAENSYLTDYQDEVSFSGKPYDYTLLLEPQKRQWVYALDMPARYSDSVHRNANYQMIGHHKAGEAAEFKLLSYPQYNTGYITKVEYRQNRQLPEEPSARVVELVTQLHGFEEDRDRYIRNVLNYFKEQQFSYTLTPPLMEKNPTETFLFEAKAGFCNHFATAFVYLMRVAHIPARVVGGYQGGEFNKVGKFLEVRQANAHAWAEVWLRGRGWVRVDPTTAIMPERVEQPVNVDQQIESGAVSLETAQSEGRLLFGGLDLEQLGYLISSLDYQWERSVVRFGSGQQSLQLGHLDMTVLMSKLYGVLTGAGLVMLVLMRGLLRERSDTEVAELKLYRRFCMKMAKAGVVIKPGEGAMDFAARAKIEKPELSDWIDEVTKEFVRLHYYPAPYQRNLLRLKKSINKQYGVLGGR